jgi:nicotinamide mononucleotide transporter
MGIWGWVHWASRERAHDNPIVRYRSRDHLVIIAVAALGALALGTLFASTSDAQRPYIDAFTTSFSFAATYMQVKKVLENWYYWIVLNVVSIWLYMDRSLDIYAMLIFIYAGLSIFGLYQWLRVWSSYSVGARSAGDY